jgi:hypothetical protein
LVRIPRAEVTQEPRIAHQPDLAGSGWGEPGRAMMKLGQGIASLGDALGSLGGGGGGGKGGANPEADFADKMTMLKTDNNIQLDAVTSKQNYTGNGDDYLEQRSTFFDDTTSKALETISPQNQPKAQLFFEQRRGPYLEDAAKFGGKLRQDTLINEINETTSAEFGKLADVPPEEFDTKFNTTVQGVDAIIKASPLPLSLKDEVAATAADNALKIFQSIKDPDQAQEILPRAMRLIDAADPAKQENLAPQELRDVGPQGTLREEGADGDPVRLNAPPGTIINGQDQNQSGVIAPNAQQGYGQQGALGTQSGLGQQRQGQGQQGQQGPQFGQINFKDFSAGRVSFRALPARDVRNIILHDVSGDPKTRRLPEPGRIPHYHVTFDDKGVYQEIPFDRQAPHARAYNKNSIGIAYRGFEGDKLSPDAIRNGAAAVKVIAEKFGIPPERILTHPGAGRMATKSGKDPREAAWRTEVLAYLEGKGPQQQVASARGVTDVTGEDIRPGTPLRKPGTIPQGQNVAQQGQAQPATQAQAVKAIATAYSPQKGGDKMEGGYASAKKGPDGKFEVRTLEDVRTGKSPYITIAGDPAQNGKSYTIPEITYIGKDGKSYTLENVKAVVHDTGSAFKGKGEGAFDIAVDRDLDDAAINKQPFSKQQIAFIPEGQEGQGGQDLKGRSLTAQAGLEGRNVQVADASGKFVPQQVAYRSVQSHLRDKLIQKLPQFKAQALRAEAEREKFEEDMRKEEADAAMVEGVTMDAQGQLTLEWIKANEPRLGPDKTTQLLRAYKSGDNVLPLEPERHLELLKTLDTDPEKGLVQATQLFLERRITRAQFDTIKREVERDLHPETKLPEYAKDWKGEVREQVATHQGDSWDRIERSQKAMQDYSDQMYALHKAGKLTPEIANKRAKEVIDNFKLRKAREDRSSLPLPEKYSKATRETMNFEELAAAEAKLAADFQAQATPLQGNPQAYQALRMKFAEDAKTLKRWRAVLSAEAVAKGEKIPPQMPAPGAAAANGEGKPADGKAADGKGEGKDAKAGEKKPQAIRKRIERDASGNITGLVEEPITDETDGGEAGAPFAEPMKLGGPLPDPRPPWQRPGAPTGQPYPIPGRADGVRNPGDNMPVYPGTQTPDDDAGGIIAPEVMEWQKEQPTEINAKGRGLPPGMMKLGGPKEGDAVVKGQIEPGNIDIDKRAVVNNADGSISTEQSFSVGVDGKEVLIPRVVNGKVLSEDEAFAHYQKTGEHLGIFDTPENANAYAESLHERQGEHYNPKEKKASQSSADDIKKQLRDKGYSDKPMPPTVTEPEVMTEEMQAEYAKILFGKEDELIAKGIPPAKAMKLGGPKEGETAETPSFGQAVTDLVKRGVAKDVETAKGILAPFKRLFAGGGWQKGPDDPQAAEDMRNVLITTGLGATGLGTRPAGSVGAFGRLEKAEELATPGKYAPTVAKKPTDWGGPSKLSQARTAERKGTSPEDIWEETGWARQPMNKTDPTFNKEAFEKYGIGPDEWYMEYGQGKMLGDRAELGIGQRRLTPPWKTAEPERAFDAEAVYDRRDSPLAEDGVKAPDAGKQIAAKDAEKAASASADEIAKTLTATEDKMRKSGASSEEIAQALSKQGEEVTAEALDKGDVWWRVTDKEKMGRGRWRPSSEVLERPAVQELITQEFNAGKSHTDIAARIEKETGVPIAHTTVSRWVHTKGMTREPLPPNRGGWSDEALAKMAKAKADGLTSEQTAQLLNKEFPAFEGKLTAGTVRKRSFRSGHAGEAGQTGEMTIPKELEPLAEQARKYKSAKEFMSKTSSISEEAKGADRLAFGVTPGEELSVDPKKLFVKYTDDLENAKAAKPKPYGADAPPIEVSLQKIDGKIEWVIEDGHNRYWAALRDGKPVKIKIDSIRTNPYEPLGFKGFDDFMEDVYNKAHKKK